MRESVMIDTAFIRLDAALKLSGAVGTGGQAKLLIQNGGVAVNGVICAMRGKKLHVGDTVCILSEKREITICASTN